MTKILQLGKFLKDFGIVLSVDLEFCKILNPLLRYKFAIEQIFFDLNDPLLNK